MTDAKRIILAVLAFAMISMASVSASAAQLDGVTFADSKITVSGSCSTSDQIQVIVFGPDHQPLFFSTVDVSDNAFHKTLDAVFNLTEGQTYTVKVADYNGKNVSTDTFTVEPGKPAHTHSFGSEWKSDGTNHWHECACGEKSDAAAHTFGEWTVTKAASASESGSKKRICTVCGYQETSVIPAEDTMQKPGDTSAPETGNPAHTHSYGSEWKSDGTNHWHECACGEKSDAAAHTFGEWTVTKAATASENGSKERICAVCGYQETSVIPAAETTQKPADPSPQTGDNSNMSFWAALLFISGGTLAVLAISANRKKQDDR